MNNTKLDNFIEGLIDQRGYADASNEERELLHNDIKEQLDRFVMTRTVSAFSAEDLDVFTTMLAEKKSTAELKQFAEDHISEYQTFMTTTLLTFQDAYLS